jgi:hypothetical protein
VARALHTSGIAQQTNGRCADNEHMTRQGKLILILTSVVSVLTLAGMFYGATLPADSPSAGGCIVNGLGARMCDETAVAYCRLHQDDLSPDSYAACRSVGY